MIYIHCTINRVCHDFPCAHRLHAQPLVGQLVISTSGLDHSVAWLTFWVTSWARLTAVGVVHDEWQTADTSNATFRHSCGWLRTQTPNSSWSLCTIFCAAPPSFRSRAQLTREAAIMRTRELPHVPALSAARFSKTTSHSIINYSYI